jgi:D-glycerate 3-kinase
MPPPTPVIRIKSTRPGFGSPGFNDAVVADVLDDALHRGARVYGIAGLQGAGKSTLAAQVTMLARERGLRVATLSIDDVYLGRRERQRLARDVHPLLATRGPPGTHDLALACDTLDTLRAGSAVRLPRFDKAVDRRLPPSRWRMVRQVDLVLFDGWCLKVPAETSAQLRDPVNPLERDEDPDGIWRRWCNERLGRDYPALWTRLDRLLWLQPPDFAPVARWRWQQEQAMRGAHSGRVGMTRTEVGRFVQHFERVSRQALRTLPGIADRTMMLDERRRVRREPERVADAAG